MINVIHDVLTPEELERLQAGLVDSVFVDGTATAGMFAEVKNNKELLAKSTLLDGMRKIVLGALQRSDRFCHLAFPLHLIPPMFNRYEVGMNYGDHFDSPLMNASFRPTPIRTDLAMTLFVSPPSAYDGGELLIHTSVEPVVSVKLPAGSLVLYPASTLHRVQPVTRGVRVAAVTWIQSMEREAERRQILGDVHLLRRCVESTMPDSPARMMAIGVYGDLVRAWADT